MLGDPRQSVDKRLIMVETDADDFVSQTDELVFAPGVAVKKKINFMNKECLA